MVSLGTNRIGMLRSIAPSLYERVSIRARARLFLPRSTKSDRPSGGGSWPRSRTSGAVDTVAMNPFEVG